MHQLTLELDPKKKSHPFETEGIKYTGSKKEIIPAIISLARKLGVKSVFDGFSGTTRVSQAFAQEGLKVWSNDLAEWSYIFGLCYLKNKTPIHDYEKWIAHLNSLKGVEGWFTENYGGSSKEEKKVWQIHNTKKLDAIRLEIDRLTEDKIERAVLLTSLIRAMDKVDSTLGHHASYLREWAPRSYNTMKMELPRLIGNKHRHNKVTKLDIFSALKKNTSELFYFDPPYGSSNEKMPPSRVRYASYYHLWTSIIKNDKPELVGVANRRADASDTLSASPFEEFRRSESGRFIAVETIEKMLKLSPAPYIVFSYSNQGRATCEELINVCKNESDDLVIIEQDHKSNIMRSMRSTKKWVPEVETKTKEFLFVLSKNGKLQNLTKN